MKIDWEKISIKELASVVSETLAGHNLDAIIAVQDICKRAF